MGRSRVTGAKAPLAKWVRRSIAGLGVVTVVAGLSGCTPARWQSQLVSQNAAGTGSANEASWLPKLSPDGTKVVFQTRASNLGPTDTNGVDDIYIRDLTTGVTRLVSANAAGTDAGDDRSMSASISRDGTKVTFGSFATNLSSVPTNGTYNSYVWDVATGTTTLVSVNAAGTGGGDAASEVGTVSPDGTKILFSSRAGDLAPPNTGAGGLYERDLQAGVTTRLADGIGGSYSPNGDAVAFHNDNGVWLRNSATGAGTLLSAGLPGNSRVEPIAFSHDGNKIAFTREVNREFLLSDIYVFDRVTRRTTLVTVGIGGGGSENAPSRVVGFHPTDPNRLLFSSTAANLVPGDTNQSEDVFIRDLARNTTTVVSATAGGTVTANRFSTQARWVGDGGKVAFVSRASDLGGTDTNEVPDIYLRDLAARTTTLVSANASGSGPGNGASGQYLPYRPYGSHQYHLSVSADGARIAFGSDANNFGPVDGDRFDNHDIYVASLVTPPS